MIIYVGLQYFEHPPDDLQTTDIYLSCSLFISKSRSIHHISARQPDAVIFAVFGTDFLNFDAWKYSSRTPELLSSSL